MRHYAFVGTFDTSELFVLEFDDETLSLQVASKHSAHGKHSWLALNRPKTHLYATCWTDPKPGLASYRIHLRDSKPVLEYQDFVPTKARPGYVCVSEKAAYSAGGPSGEVYAVKEDGNFGELMQELWFVDEATDSSAGGGVLDFGGLRHGAHSADLSPDGKTLYVADIGRNCVWVMPVDEDGKTSGQHKSVATRANDGPRHAWPHPNGKIVYSLQEHSSYVDVFEKDGHQLVWKQGVRIIAEDKDEKDFWADEVRLSLGSSLPTTLFASTRGLESKTKGYVTAFELLPSGLFTENDAKPLAIFETATSGGWANAIEPAPWAANGIEWLMLTDSEEGLVSVIRWDGKKLEEVAKTKIDGGAATTQWYS